MEQLEYGCNDADNDDVKDADTSSLVSEKCWKETYRGDSRRWLMRDGSKWKESKDRSVSTMKACYPFPPQDERKFIGERRGRLLQKLYDEAAAEIIQEREEPPSVEDYCTEYDVNYNIPGCGAGNEHHQNKELHEQYPLYTSAPMSYWNFQIEQTQRSWASLAGLTASKDLKSPFKRNSGFTKPISEVLDDVFQL